jgi:hypothetical protein
MSERRFLLTVATKLPIAMVGRQTIPTAAEVYMKGILSGQRIERREVGPAGAFDTMTDDELERALLERFNALGNQFRRHLLSACLYWMRLEYSTRRGLYSAITLPCAGAPMPNWHYNA